MNGFLINFKVSFTAFAIYYDETLMKAIISPAKDY